MHADLGLDELYETWLVRKDPNWVERPYKQFLHAFFKKVDDGKSPGIRFEPLGDDRRAYLESVTVASEQADRTIASLHEHQAPGGVRNTDKTSEYVRSFARDCVDPSADLFVGSGPHVLRG